MLKTTQKERQLKLGAISLKVNQEGEKKPDNNSQQKPQNLNLNSASFFLLIHRR